LVILAQDPSFNALAFSLYDGENTVYIDNSSYTLGESIGFNKVFVASMDLWEQYKKRLEHFRVGNGINIDVIFSEIPPPVANFAAGLFALDTFILYQLFRSYSTIRNVYTIPPSYLSTVHETSKYKKSDSTKLAKYFIQDVLSDYIKVVVPDNVSSSGRRTKGQINNDRAESFLFLLRAFSKYDIMGLRNKINSEMKGFGVEVESLLIKR